MKQYLYRLWQWIGKGIPVMKVPAQVGVLDSSKLLAGKKVMVTGGSQGVGYHLAQALVNAGAEVLIVGRDEKKLQKAAKELQCQYLPYDLNDTEHYTQLIADAAQKMGRLTGLINNAAICNIDNGFLNVTQKSYDEQFLLNVKAPFFLTQAFVSYVTENKIAPSAVLFITSERGLYPDDAPYGMTKAAIGNIIAGIARQFATKGVHINGIAPGVVANTLGDPKKFDDLYLKGAVGKRYILPQELGQVAVFLLSNLSVCISGEIIPCDQCNYLK